MLKFFNRLERTRNFVLLVFAVLMIAGLVLFYRPMGDTLGADLSRSHETAASVAGEDITVGEVYRQKEAYSRYSQGPAFPAKTILNDLIGNRIARVEARRLGLTASNAEVAAAIRQQSKPTDGKPFDINVYEQNAIDQAGSVSAYEEGVRDSLSAIKVRAFVTSGVSVSEEEVLEDFKRKNAKFDLVYVGVNPMDLAQTITPTDQELQDYFEKNKQMYYISVPQKKIKYIFINTTKIGEKLPITDEELKAEYDKLPDDRKKAGVLGQEIVLRIPSPEQDSQVAAKAGNLVQQLRKDQPVTETAFADVAKGQSENPATAPNGGHLKGPVKENPSNPTDPYQQLLNMKPGEITDPISYQGRYFILRRGEAVPKSFEDAKKELEVSLRNRKAYGVAAELAQKVSESLKQTKDLDKTAAEFAPQANMTVAEMIKETPYVKPGDNIDNIGTSPQFEEGISGLENQNDVGDKIPIQNGFAIPLLADKKEPRDSTFDEARSQVVEAVKMDKARAQVEEIAKQLAGTTSASALAAAAQSKGLKAEDSKSFTIGSPLGKGPSASTNKELEDAIYGLRVGDVTKTPIKIGDGWFVVGVTKRDEANMDLFAKQRDTLMEQMLEKRRGEVFADYLLATRRRMDQSGEIKIYDDAVAKVDAATEAPTEIPGQ